jgi:hypothetical protein
MTTTMTLLQPSKEDLQYRYSVHAFVNHFGGWGKFVNTIGEEQYHSYRTKDDMINDYKHFKFKFNRRPTMTDYDRRLRDTNGLSCSVGPITRCFGGFNNFIKLMGDTPLSKLSKNTQINKHEAKEGYYRFKNELLLRGENLLNKKQGFVYIPSHKFTVHTGAPFSPNMIKPYYRTWHKFLVAIGEFDDDIIKTNLKQAYYKLKKDYPYGIRWKDFKKIASVMVVKKLYGNYDNFVRDIEGSDFVWKIFCPDCGKISKAVKDSWHIGGDIIYCDDCKKNRAREVGRIKHWKSKGWTGNGPPPLVEKKCVICKSKFQCNQKQLRKIYCSQRCMNQTERSKTYQREWQNRHYKPLSSVKRYNEHHPLLSKKCPYCHTTFTTRSNLKKYCNRICTWKHKNAVTRGRLERIK